MPPWKCYGGGMYDSESKLSNLYKVSYANVLKRAVTYFGYCCANSSRVGQEGLTLVLIKLSKVICTIISILVGEIKYISSIIHSIFVFVLVLILILKRYALLIIQRWCLIYIITGGKTNIKWL